MRQMHVCEITAPPASVSVLSSVCRFEFISVWIKTPPQNRSCLLPPSRVFIRQGVFGLVPFFGTTQISPPPFRDACFWFFVGFCKTSEELQVPLAFSDADLALPFPSFLARGLFFSSLIHGGLNFFPPLRSQMLVEPDYFGQFCFFSF